MSILILISVLVLVAVLMRAQLDTSWYPTPQDDALRLEAEATRTATFAGTSYDQGPGFSPGGLGQQVAAVVVATAVDRANSDETYSFVLQESADNSTWTNAGPAVARTTTGVFSVPGWISQRYTRLNVTLGGTTPSLTYEAHLNANL